MTFRLSFFVFLFCLFFASPAHAFRVEPAVFSISAPPGRETQGQMTLTNTANTPRRFYFERIGFSVAEDGTTPILSSSADGAAPWIELSFPFLDLSAGETREVNFMIRVPEAMPGGTYTAAITVSPAPSDIVSSGVSVEAKVAMPLFINVPGFAGDGAAELVVLDILPKEGKRIWMRAPVSFEYRLQNQGRTLTIPNGEIHITTRHPFRRLDANPTRGRLLPNTTRTYEVIWDGCYQEETCEKPFRFGFHEVTLTIHGASNVRGAFPAESDETVGYASTWFFVVTPMSIVIMVGILAVLSTLIFMVRRKKRL